jgi:hypothetical protein
MYTGQEGISFWPVIYTFPHEAWPKISQKNAIKGSAGLCGCSHHLGQFHSDAAKAASIAD